ncbi:hypothetical protein JOE37_000122 [Clavibacter michiganensis]|nr:hypothetical protein [Clavibacter michiganensis]
MASFAGGLGAKLATRSRHVCTFFGAGTSKAAGLPDVAELTERISKRLSGEDRRAFTSLAQRYTLEQGLSRLRRIQALVEKAEAVDGLTQERARSLDAKICAIISSELSAPVASNGALQDFASWVGRADYAKPVEVFTVNYDLLIEAALEHGGIPYFDGFVGNIKGAFRTDMVEASAADSEMLLPSFVARLWKLHGSINWAWEDAASPPRVTRRGVAIDKDGIAAIFPSDSKYEESRRMPFVVLQDRLRRALNEPETLVLISGYSWGDAHLNELFLDAAARRPRSEFIAFCYGEIPLILAESARTTPNLQVVSTNEAILGGLRGPWQAPPDGEQLPTDIWDGANCGLGDFTMLASFLARSSSSSLYSATPAVVTSSASV